MLFKHFLRSIHSIIDAINPVFHTPEGAIVYGLDKRIDYTPVLGDPIDMQRFREIGREGVLCYIEDCTNANRKWRTPSESVAQSQLRDVILSLEEYLERNDDASDYGWGEETYSKREE